MFNWSSWVGVVGAIVIALVIAVVMMIVAAISLRIIGRRGVWPKTLARRTQYPVRVLLILIAGWAALAIARPTAGWRPIVDQVFLVSVIATGAWLVAALVTFLINRALSRYPVNIAGNRVARRMHTQLALVRRLAIVVIAILAIGGILFTFDGVQAIGASVLASAGVLSIVAGLAAQSTLANVFAGVQLAFSDAIRLEDVVIADGEWGQIEEITLTYVVVRIWDDRRLVVPSTYFTSTPFQNWTRNSSELLGSVELDLDWRVSPAAMRVELERIVAASELWDGRTVGLQITDAVGGLVRVRVLVSAADSSLLWDLRCEVREQLVEWVYAQNPDALPLARVELLATAGRTDEQENGE